MCDPARQVLLLATAPLRKLFHYIVESLLSRLESAGLYLGESICFWYGWTTGYLEHLFAKVPVPGRVVILVELGVLLPFFLLVLQASVLEMEQSEEIRAAYEEAYRQQEISRKYRIKNMKAGWKSLFFDRHAAGVGASISGDGSSRSVAAVFQDPERHNEYPQIPSMGMIRLGQNQNSSSLLASKGAYGTVRAISKYGAYVETRGPEVANRTGSGKGFLAGRSVQRQVEDEVATRTAHLSALAEVSDAKTSTLFDGSSSGTGESPDSQSESGPETDIEEVLE